MFLKFVQKSIETSDWVLATIGLESGAVYLGLFAPHICFEGGEIRQKQSVLDDNKSEEEANGMR